MLKLNIKKISKFVYLLIVIFILLLLGCSTEEIDDADSDSLFRVELAKAESSTISISYEESGETVPWRQTVLVPKVPGEVVRVEAGSGVRVTEGQVIFRMENTHQSIQLKQAEAGHKAMERELNELKKLSDAGIVPEGEYRKLKAEFEQLELNLQLARYGYEVTIVRAPFNGIVTDLMIEEGQLVGTEPVGRVMDYNLLKTRVAVGEEYIQHFREGMPVMVEIPSAGVTKEGEVITVGKATIPETRSFLVEIRIENYAGNINPGVFARIYLDIDAQEGVLVSGTAVTERMGKSYIYVPDISTSHRNRQTAKLIEIETGTRHDGKVQVTSGLSPGDEYIKRPPPGFRDGSEYLATGGKD